jgi:hypothetical protein
MGRKKPFSAKAKRTQLLAKREAKRGDDEAGTSSAAFGQPDERSHTQSHTRTLSL